MTYHVNMIRCPNCQFEQPEDQYCANCGVDMQKFKPKLNLKTPAMYSLFIAIILLSAAYILSTAYKMVNAPVAVESPEFIEENVHYGYESSLKGTPRETIDKSQEGLQENQATVQNAAAEPATTPLTATDLKISVVFKEVPLVEIENAMDDNERNSELFGIISGEPFSGTSYLNKSQNLTGNLNEVLIQNDYSQYSIQLNIRDIQNNRANILMQMTRELFEPLNKSGVFHQASFESVVPYSSVIYFVDPLPRIPAEELPEDTSSLVPSLHSSQSFIESQTELVLEIKVSPQ